MSSSSKSEKTLFLIFCSTLLVLSTLSFFPHVFYPYLLEALSLESTNYDVASSAIILEPVGTDDSDIYPEIEEDHTPLMAAVPEEDVVVISQGDFTDFILKHKYVMVNFYAPWCFWSNKLEPEYAAAATLLRDTEAVVAKYDCTRGPNGCRTFHKVDAYPTMVLFVDGGAQKVVYDPADTRTGDAIANWIRLKMSPHVQTVEATWEVERILSNKPMIVLAFLDNLQDPVSEELTTVAKLHTDTEFYQTTNADVARMFHIDPEVKRPALFMLKREIEMNHTHFSFDGELTSSAISDFVLVNKLPLVVKFTEEDAPLIFDYPKKQLWLFSPRHSCEVTSIFKQAALAFKGKLLFVHVETHSTLGKQLSFSFGVPDFAPRVMAYMANGNPKKQIYNGELTSSGIESFVNEFLEDKLMVRSHSDTDSVILKLLKLARVA